MFSGVEEITLWSQCKSLKCIMLLFASFILCVRGRELRVSHRPEGHRQVVSSVSDVRRR